MSLAFLPARQRALGPVAIGAAHVDHPQGGKLGQHFVDLVGRRVVGVNDERDAQLLFGDEGHEVSFVGQAVQA
jgi:hypothetical protein